MDDDHRIVRNSGQINSILRRLHTGRSPLTVRLPGRVGEFRSAVILVDGRRQCLQLDELSPERGHRFVEEGTLLRVVSNTDGVETRFTAKVARIDIENDIYFYETPIPTEILYHQRRQYVRVPVPMTSQESVTLHREDETLTVRLTDLSIGGFGGYLLSDAKAPLRGDMWEFVLRLRDHAPLGGNVEIRHASEDRVRHRQNFGAQFMGMKPPERRRLERIIVSLQRQLLRRT